MPDCSCPAWIAVLFAAGTGIGLMLSSVHEPVHHVQTSRLGVDPADTEPARKVGMAATISHWGLRSGAI